jgi:hypothetical protein
MAPLLHYWLELGEDGCRKWGFMVVGAINESRVGTHGNRMVVAVRGQNFDVDRAKVENGRKRTKNRSIVFIFIFLDKNGSGSRTTGSENGSRINGNTKTGKYDRKIDGNEW